MKRALYISTVILSSFVWSACVKEPANTHSSKVPVSNFSADTLFISNQFQSQLEGWNAGSINEYMQAYHKSADLQFITSKGVLKGWQAVHDNYLRAFPNQERMGALNFKVDQYTFLGDSLIQTTGTWQVSKQDTVRSGYFSLIWKQFPTDNWKIIVDHTW